MIAVVIFFIVFILFPLAITLFSSDKYLDPDYHYFSCGMENNHQRTCFIFKGRNINEVVLKVKSMSHYGWYYDSVIPLKEITLERAEELISVGAYYR